MQVRSPARIAVTASTTFAGAQGTVAVNLRASPPVEIELHPFVAAAHTATVAVQRIDELQLADFPGTTLDAGLVRLAGTHPQVALRCMRPLHGEVRIPRLTAK